MAGKRRRRDPSLVPEQVCSILSQHIHGDSVKALQERGYFLKYNFGDECKDDKGLSHKVDKSCMWDARLILKDLLMISPIFDKTILERGIALCNRRVSMHIQDTRLEAYILKRLQMDVLQIARNSKSGTRLDAWVKDLTQLVQRAGVETSLNAIVDGAATPPAAMKLDTTETSLKAIVDGAAKPPAAMNPPEAPRRRLLRRTSSATSNSSTAYYGQHEFAPIMYEEPVSERPSSPEVAEDEPPGPCFFDEHRDRAVCMLPDGAEAHTTLYAVKEGMLAFVFERDDGQFVWNSEVPALSLSKKPAAMSDSEDTSIIAAAKKPMKKSIDKKPAAALTAKILYSRQYHKAVEGALLEGHDEAKAKELGRVAAKAALRGHGF